jgi:UV DNA damage endonuclease
LIQNYKSCFKVPLENAVAESQKNQALSDKGRGPLPALGLVCITASDAVRYKTITRKRLLALDLAEQQTVLRTLYAENLRRLNSAIEFCHRHNIWLYRLPSSPFPFADDTLGEAILADMRAELAQVGQLSHTLGIRLVLHPDQFVVLNSDRPDVIANSIKILSAQARTFDWMGLPQSSWTAMNVHGGKGDRAERLVSVIRDLPDSIRLRLTLENDEYTYRAAEMVDICRAATVPLVFDAHHHIVHEKLDSYEHPSVAEMLAAARTTWSVPDWQLVHISNGRNSFQDQQHSDFIYDMPSSYREVSWIEVEAKQKEAAIARLQQEWLPQLLPQ